MFIKVLQGSIVTGVSRRTLRVWECGASQVPAGDEEARPART